MKQRKCEQQRWKKKRFVADFGDTLPLNMEERAAVEETDRIIKKMTNGE